MAEASEVKRVIPTAGTTYKRGADTYTVKGVGQEDQTLPTGKYDKNGKPIRVKTGKIRNLSKTVANVTDQDCDRNINEWKALECTNLSLGMTASDYAGAPKSEKVEILHGLEIGDRLTWNLRMFDFLMIRETGEDRKISFYRNMKVKQLADRGDKTDRTVKKVTLKSGKPAYAPEDKHLDGNPYFIKGCQGSPQTLRSGVDFTSFTEVPAIQNADGTTTYRGALRWKKVPRAFRAKALLNIATLILDDVGRGRSVKYLKKFYVEVKYDPKTGKTKETPLFKSKNEALDFAVKSCVEARKLLESNDPSIGMRDYYAIGKCYVTEAKLRVLRRRIFGKDKIAGDTTPGIKALLDKWINGYTLDTEKTFAWDEWDPIQKKDVRQGPETHTIREWIDKNLKIEIYAQSDIDPKKDPYNLVKSGVVYLHAMAMLEKAKLSMEDTNPTKVLQAANLAQRAKNMLVGPESTKYETISKYAKLMSGYDVYVKKGEIIKGQKYVVKTGDYAHFDALITKADLIKLYGNLVEDDETEWIKKPNGDPYTGKQALRDAYDLYVSMDDVVGNLFVSGKKATDDYTLYLDLIARAIDSRINLQMMFEVFNYGEVDKNIKLYYDAEVRPGDLDVMSPFFESSYQYYAMLITWGRLLVARNRFSDDYPVSLPNLNDGYGVKTHSLYEHSGDYKFRLKEHTKVADAALSKFLFLDTIQNCTMKNVKATNPRGINDLRNRAYLGYAQAEAALLMHEDFATRRKKIKEIIGRLQDILIKIDGGDPSKLTSAQKEAKAKEVFGKILACTERKYPNVTGINSMDYPFFIELFNTWATVMEQSAWLETRDARSQLTKEDIDGNTPLFQSIKAKFKPVQDKLAQVKELCKVKGKSDYDKHLRPIAIELQKASLETYKINIEAKVASKEEAKKEVLDKIDAQRKAVRALFEDKLGLSIGELKKLLESGKVIKERGAELIQVGKNQFLKKTLEDLVAKAFTVESELIIKKLFFVSKQHSGVYSWEEKKSMIIGDKGYFRQAKMMADWAMERVTDPYYLVNNIIGAALVYMSFEPQAGVDKIVGEYGFYTRYVEKDPDAMMSYSMAEGVGICAAVTSDKKLAHNVIASLESTIGTLIKFKTADTDEALARDHQLSQAYMWIGNLKAWLFNEKTERGYSAELKAALKAYENAIVKNPENLSAKLGLQNVNVRLATFEYTEAIKAKVHAKGTDFSAISGKLLAAYLAAAKEYKEIMSAKASATKVLDMSEREREIREAQYIASQVKAYLALKLIEATMPTLTDTEVYVITDLKDGVKKGKRHYFEARVSVGERVSKVQLDRINEGRAKQKLYGLLVFENKDPDIGAKKASSTSISTTNPIYTQLMSIINDDKWGTLTNGRLKTLLDPAGIYRMSGVEQTSYEIDRGSLEAGLKVMPLVIAAAFSPTQENLDALNAKLKELEGKYKDRPKDKVKSIVLGANVNGWVAMGKSTINELEKAADDYKGLIDEYGDSGLLRNQVRGDYAEVLSLIFFQEKNEVNFSNAVAALMNLGDRDNSTVGAMADIKLADILIAFSGKRHNKKTVPGLEKMELDFKKAATLAMRALERLTGYKAKNLPEAIYLYPTVIRKSEDLMSDKLVMQALCFLTISTAWISTTKHKSAKLQKKSNTKVIAQMEKVKSIVKDVRDLAKTPELKLEHHKYFRGLLDETTDASTGVSIPKSESGLLRVIWSLDRAIKGLPDLEEE
ncbi:hypothetical protein ACFL4F_01325 [Candidatus Margulisiibacteriota bacterium]